MKFKEMLAFKKSLTVLSKCCENLVQLSKINFILGFGRDDDEDDDAKNAKFLKDKASEVSKIIYEKTSMSSREAKLRKISTSLYISGLLDDDLLSKI